MQGFRPSRRELLAFAASAVSVPGARAGTGTPHRRNIDALGRQELQTYEHAVGLFLAARPAAQMPFDPAGSPGHWDRAGLAAIERALRATDPARTGGVSIPYWDVSRAPSGRVWPAAFERAGSPLHAARSGLDPAMWSYHAFLDRVWRLWEEEAGPLPPGVTAHLALDDAGPRIVTRRLPPAWRAA